MDRAGDSGVGAECEAVVPGGFSFPVGLRDSLLRVGAEEH